MKMYNRIMEFFWMISGVLILGFATYSHFTHQNEEYLFEMVLAGIMAIFLSVFRIMYRKHTDKMDNEG